MLIDLRTKTVASADDVMENFEYLKGEIDDIDAGTGGADASTTVKGTSKLSYAPASPTEPIARADNDPANFTGTERTKLTGIAANATANDTDANLKSRTNHTGTQAQSTITNLATDLAAKADAGAVTTALAAKADLVGGVVPTSQLPAITIGETFTVASQAAMLALSAQQGDVAIRTDQSNKKYLLIGNSATLADWKNFDSTGAVSSVNSQTGAVTLGAADVGALASTNNLSDLSNAVTARANLGLGDSSTRNVGTTSGTVAAGDDARFGTSGGASATNEVQAITSSVSVVLDAKNGGTSQTLTPGDSYTTLQTKIATDMAISPATDIVVAGTTVATVFPTSVTLSGITMTPAMNATYPAASPYGGNPAFNTGSNYIFWDVTASKWGVNSGSPGTPSTFYIPGTLASGPIAGVGTLGTGTGTPPTAATNGTAPQLAITATFSGSSVAGLPQTLMTTATAGASIVRTTAGGTKAQSLQGVAIATTAPSNGQMLIYSAALQEWTPTVLASGYVSPSFIDGLVIEWLSTSSIKVKSGAAYIPSLGAILDVTSDITVTGISLGASTWGHVYLTSAGAIEINTTAPGVAYRGTARCKTSDISRRYLGSIPTNAANALLNMVWSGGGAQLEVFYREAFGTGALRVLPVGVATTETTVPASAVVPVSARIATVRIGNSATAGILWVGTSDDSASGPPSSGLNAAIPNTRVISKLILDSSQAFTYWYDVTPTGGSGGFDILGYQFAR